MDSDHQKVVVLMFPNSLPLKGSPAINVNAAGLKSGLKHKWRQLGVVGLDANHQQKQQEDVEKRTVTRPTMPGSGQKVSPACGVQSWVGFGVA